MRRITSLLTWLCVVAGSSISMGVAENDFFGSSVALSSDGNTAIIGADCADVGGITNQGAGYVFTRGGSGWTQQAKLTASDGAAWDRFGASVALSSDGNTAIAGAYLADVDGNDGQGAAYVFTWSGASWNQQAKLIATGGDATDFFGSSVALSSDGDTAII
ncbi:MAG: FG-GAP repeat protein, partial [Verrucomicrobia bacterium]|nr:FG-GAP repeat protein [Verrucomicrobiota bacterium]